MKRHPVATALFIATVLSLSLFLLFLVLADTDPEFIGASPTNYSNLTGTVTFTLNYSYELCDYNLSWSNGSGWNDICHDYSRNPPQSCDWNTLLVPDFGNYTINFTVTNSSNSTFNTTIFLVGITVDNTPPNLTIYTPDDSFISDNATLFFNWSVTDSVDTNVSCGFFLDDTLNTTQYNESTNLTLNLTDGTHDWYVNCSDYTGNPNVSDTRQLLVDTTLPNITNVNFTYTWRNFINSSFFINITVDEANLDACDYSMDAGRTWSNMTLLSGTPNYCYVTPGAQENNITLNFTFRANDTAGNLYNYTEYNETINRTVDAVAPHLDLLAPLDDQDTSDNYTFLVTVSINDTLSGVSTCLPYLDGNQSKVLGTLTYDSLTNTCSGNIAAIQDSGLSGSTLLSVIAYDNVSNMNLSSIYIYIDNSAPTFLSATTNVTNNALPRNDTSFRITAVLSDHSARRNLTVRNATQSYMTNTSALNVTSATYEINTTPSALGCPNSGACKLTLAGGDIWGNNITETLYIIIDNSTPDYTVNGTNATSPAGWQEHARIYANWSDDSLGAASPSSEAVLYKYRAGTAISFDSVSLNSSLSWSNFSYFVNASEDEGLDTTFFITLTDLAGYSNSTENLTITVENRSPKIAELRVLNLVRNATNATPRLSFMMMDEGVGIASAVVNLTRGNSSVATYTYPSSRYTCTVEDTQTVTLAADETANFNLSYYNSTPYAVTLANISDAAVILTRVGYARDGPADTNTSLLGEGATEFIGALGITVDAIYNDGGLKANITFTDRDLQRLGCNLSLANTLTGLYNATLRVTDGRGNTNTSMISWIVDGTRPEVTSLTADGERVVTDNVISNASIYLTTDSAVQLNWTINDTNLNFTLLRRGWEVVRNDTTGRLFNSTDVVLDVGANFFNFSLGDVINYATPNTTLFWAHVNKQVDVTVLRDELTTGFTSAMGAGETPAELKIYKDGTEIQDDSSGYLNGSVSLRFVFNSSDANVTVEAGGLYGLTYYWNNTEGFGFRQANDTADARVAWVESRAGIAPRRLITVSGYASANSTNYTRFLPDATVTQSSNWTFNASGNLSIVLVENEDVMGHNTYLLTSCAVPGAVTTFADACYVGNDSVGAYTIYAPRLTGFAYGVDVAAPNVSIVTPANGSTVANSFFTINISVVDPNIDTCSYEFWLSNTTQIGSETLSLSNFTLQRSAYYYTKTYHTLDDSTRYYLNVTCNDTNGLNGSTAHNFTVDDTTPPVLTTATVSAGYTTATINFSTNELAAFRVNYSSVFDNLSSSTNFSSYSFGGEYDFSGLADNTRYYYRVDACDEAGNCNSSPVSPGTFLTSEITYRDSGGASGGGGGLVEGMVLSSDYHKWNEILPGWFEYPIDREQLAVTHVGFNVINKTFNAYIDIKGYFGKPANTPVVQPIAYQYFRITHDEIVGFVEEYELGFRVPEAWLANMSATPQDVHLFRLQQGEWVEYEVSYEKNSAGYAYFMAQLPGFSTFVVTADGVLPEGSGNGTGASTVGDDSGSEGSSGGDSGVTGGVVDDGAATDDGTITDDGESGTVAGYGETKKGLGWLWIIVAVLVVILVVGVVAYYYKQRMDELAMKRDVKLSEDDPLYKLQVFIHKALDHGYKPEQIKAKLLGVGWDEIVVEEELEKAVTSRI